MSIGFAVGVMLGVLFYGGLWITVRSLMVTQHPLAVTLGSLLLRMAVVLAGMLMVARGRWQNALAALAGFAIGRAVVSKVWVCT